MPTLHLLLWMAAGYGLLTLFLTYGVHRVPRNPVRDPPDWGRITDTRIPSIDGGSLEVWRVDPGTEPRGVVLLAHGWSRNRDRMVPRARMFGQMGFSTVIHSARDHGNSSPFRFMNAMRFSEDIDAVMDWIGEPVLLYGHSAGAAAAAISANRRPHRVRLLFLESCYPFTRQALRSLYRSYNRVFGWVFGPAIVLWMDVFYRFQMDRVSPARLAPGIDLPVLIVHGEKDESFPLPYARVLRDSFPAGRAEVFVGRGADHSGCSLTPEYPEAIGAFLNRRLGSRTHEYPALPGRHSGAVQP